VLFRMTLSNLAKYSMTRSVALSVCNSWACLNVDDVDVWSCSLAIWLCAVNRLQPSSTQFNTVDQPLMFVNLSSKLILCQKSLCFWSTDPKPVLRGLTLNASNLCDIRLHLLKENQFAVVHTELRASEVVSYCVVLAASFSICRYSCFSCLT